MPPKESGQIGKTPVYALDPLQDSRWVRLVEQHGDASVFHSRAWLQALHSTYGYEPIAVTTAHPSEPLSSAMVFCLVKSWLTGDRLVSLPFSDHCEPLVTQSWELSVLTRFVEALRNTQRWKYVQIRSANAALNSGGLLKHTTTYCLHRLDLRPSLDDLYRGLHKDCIQRKLRRAEREGVVCEVGQSEILLAQFYELLCMTRARHGVPPQPIEWFHNLVACMGSSLCIRIASKSGRPVAGILTLRHGRQVLYKYGASDKSYNHLGGMPMLLWEAIKDAKQDGMESLDLGRSDLGNAGLILFKERWAAKPVSLMTWQAPGSNASVPREGWIVQCAKGLLGCLPQSVQTTAGRFLYRHAG
jgi:CelD/BcsL family acetyltransferase involved in cellulose biosynthesis